MLEKIKKITWYNLVNNLKDILEGLWNKPAGSVTWGSVEDKPTTFAPTIGTTASTAKAGNYQPTWVQVTGKPEIIASGATQAEARTAIGAGTGNSNLAIGTTASTAKAGNYTPSATEVVAAFNAMTPEQIEEIQLLLGVTP